MTRQYKAMQNEMSIRIHQLEADLTRTRAQLGMSRFLFTVGCISVYSRPTRNYQTYRATPPTFLIWNNLCDLVYQWPTRSYLSQTAVT